MRTKRIPIFFTEEEHATIKEQAKEANLSMRDFLMLRKPNYEKPRVFEDYDSYELRKIIGKLDIDEPAEMYLYSLLMREIDKKERF